MSSIIKDFWNTILNRKSFYIPLSIISLMGYGFSLFNRTIGWDDLLRDHYFGSGNISLSGRWGMVAWVKLLGFMDFDPFVDRFTALLFLLVASVLFCILLYSIKRLESVHPYTITACIFVSYPLINELWEYCGANFFMTGGLALSTMTICLLRNYQHCNRLLGISGLLLLLPISSYESAIFYYLSLVCMVIFLDNIYYGKYRNFRSLFKDICYYVIPIVIAFVLRITISFGIRIVMGLDGTGGGATGIHWLSNTPLIVLTKMLSDNFIKYMLGALVYFPITEFLIALLLFTISIFLFFINKKKVIVLLYGLVLVLSLFSQAFLQGAALPYRTAQTITLFMALVAFLLAEKVVFIQIKTLRIICYVVLYGVCWHQAGSLNRYLGLNNLRSENEAFLIRSIGERIIRDYDEKPVVFVSPYTYNMWVETRVKIGNDSWNEKMYNTVLEKIYPGGPLEIITNKSIETNINSATEEYSQIQDIFSYYGFDINVVGPIEKPHTPGYVHKDLKLLEEATKIAKDSNMRPYQIKDMGKYLIVTLSNKPNVILGNKAYFFDYYDGISK